MFNRDIQTPRTDIQTPRRELKIERAAEYFFTKFAGGAWIGDETLSLVFGNDGIFRDSSFKVFFR